MLGATLTLNFPHLKKGKYLFLQIKWVYVQKDFKHDLLSIADWIIKGNIHIYKSK